MPFNSMLLTCLTNGTSYTEAGNSVRLSPASRETVLFFGVDDQSDDTRSLRPDFGISGPICDLIVFYRNERENRTVVCLIELKGSELEYAANQIVNTYRHVAGALNQYAHRRSDEYQRQYECVEWKAYIKVHRGSHTQHGTAQDCLQKVFGKDNYDIRRNPDIGQFLRG
jgi:hypothetical protein